MTFPPQTFPDADRQRFTEIKAELGRRLPRARPDSEEVYRCALLFAEVKAKGYQGMDGHQECEPWMWRLYRITERQAQKYFHTATLPPQEVAGKHQGVEITGQIGQMKDPLVRQAMWQLVEDEGVSDKALSAARVRMQPYLDQGRRQQGIEVLRRVAQRKAQEEAVEREQKRRTPLRAGARGVASIEQTDRILDRLLAGQGEASQAEAEALVFKGLGLLEKFRLLAQQRGIPWKSQTSEEPSSQGGEQATSATEQPEQRGPGAVTQPVTVQAAGTATAAAPGKPAEPEAEQVTETTAAAGAATAEAPTAQTATAQTTAAQTATAEATAAQNTAAQNTAAASPYAAGMGPSVQFPMEVQAFRPLFRFFHEGLTPGRQDWVQRALVLVVQGSHPGYRISELHRELRPFLPDGHPMKKYMTRLAAGLRPGGLDGRRFALYCLIALQLPGWEQHLMDLSKAELPAGLRDLVLYYRNLLLGLS